MSNRPDAASLSDYAHHNEDAERIFYEEHRYEDSSEYEYDDWYDES